MAKAKKYVDATRRYDRDHMHSPSEAIDLVKTLASAKFDESVEVAVRLGAARDLLIEHGNYSWLTEKGNLVVLNNGIEFAATYFIILLVLFFIGAGKLSVDHLVVKHYGNC